MASLSLIDVCLGCYLTDHHNRKGELLLGVSVNNSTSYAEVREGLADEFHAIGWDTTDGAVSSEDFERALVECFSEVKSLEAPFDPSLDDPSEDDMGEECCAWFLLEY